MQVTQHPGVHVLGQTGGVLTRATRLMAGEAGAEALIPLTGSIGVNFFKDLFKSAGVTPDSSGEKHIHYHIDAVHVVDNDEVKRQIFNAMHELELYNHM
jgi:hypothetical protein